MASRAVWKGQLRLSLVAIPVEVHPATQSSAKIRFRQIHKPSGKPVRYEKTVEGLGRISADDILKGYETGDGEYVLIEPADVEAVRLETRRTLELVQFVDQSEIAPLYYDKPYYVVPTDKLAQDAYRVVRDALRRTGRVGLGQLAMRGKEYLCALRPCGDGLLLETLHYRDELRSAEPLFSQIEDDEVDSELLEVAETLIERKTAPFDPDAFSDHYAEALRELIEQKVRNRRTPRATIGREDERAAPGDRPGNVIDLMEALRRSLGDERPRSKKAAPGKAAPKKPASGNASAKAPAKAPPKAPAKAPSKGRRKAG